MSSRAERSSAVFVASPRSHSGGLGAFDSAKHTQPAAPHLSPTRRSATRRPRLLSAVRMWCPRARNPPRWQNSQYGRYVSFVLLRDTRLLGLRPLSAGDLRKKETSPSFVHAGVQGLGRAPGRDDWLGRGGGSCGPHTLLRLSSVAALQRFGARTIDIDDATHDVLAAEYRHYETYDANDAPLTECAPVRMWHS